MHHVLREHDFGGVGSRGRAVASRDGVGLGDEVLLDVGERGHREGHIHSCQNRIAIAAHLLEGDVDGIPHHVVGQVVVVGQTEGHLRHLLVVGIGPLHRGNLRVGGLADDHVVVATQAALRNGHEAEVDVRRFGNIMQVLALRLGLSRDEVGLSVVAIDVHPVATTSATVRRVVAGCVDGQQVGAVVDGGVAVEALDAIEGRGFLAAFVFESRQADDHVGGAVASGAVALCHKHAFAVAQGAAGTPDTEVLLAVSQIHGVVLITHLVATACRGTGTVDGVVVEIFVVAHPAAVVGVVIFTGDDVARFSALLRTGIGAGVVGIVAHHVGEAFQLAVLNCVLVVNVFNLNEGAVAHADLVGRLFEARGLVSHLGVHRSRIIDVVHLIAAELLHLVGGIVEEDGAAVVDAHLLELVDGVLLGGDQRVDLTFTEEDDVRVDDVEAVGTLHRVERTRGRAVRQGSGGLAGLDDLTILLDDDVATLLTGIARGAAAVDGATDVHVVGAGRVVALGVIACAVDVDVGASADGRVTELGAVVVTEVTAGPHRTTDAQRLVGVEEVQVGIGVVVHMVGGVEDGVGADEGIGGAKHVAEVARGKHLVVGVAARVVDHRGRGVGSAATKGARAEGEGIVGVTRAAVDVLVDRAATHVDHAHTSHVDAALGTEGTAEHRAFHCAAVHVDNGTAIGEAHRAATEHVAGDGAARNLDGADGRRVGQVAFLALGAGVGGLLDVAVFAAAIDALGDGAAADGHRGGAADVGCGATALAGAEDVLHRATADGNVGVARNSAEFATAVHIIINGAAADVDHGVLSHDGATAVAAAKDIGGRAAAHIDGGVVVDGALCVGTAIEAALNGTILHPDVHVLAFLHVGAAKHGTFHRAAKDIEIRLIGLTITDITIVTTTIHIALDNSRISDHNGRTVDTTHRSVVTCGAAIATTCAKDVAACGLAGADGSAAAIAVTLGFTAKVDIGFSIEFTAIGVGTITSTGNPTSNSTAREYKASVTRGTSVLSGSVYNTTNGTTFHSYHHSI